MLVSATNVVMSNSSSSKKTATRIKWLAALVILAALFLLARALPIQTGVERLERWVAGMGMLGPIVFGAIYVAAALLFVPGAALTIAAGAVFGLVGWILTVSVASTASAALAFLAARYLLRSRIEELARRQPRFGAIDSAIGDGGWKIIAMLRLVPLFPFSAGNYLFGLTSARFWPYVAASWLFMLPGTFMFVYIGYLGVTSLEAASSADASVGVGRIALLVVGLLALVGATVYLTRLAKRRLQQVTPVEPTAVESVPTAPAGRGAFATIAISIVAAGLMGTALWARANSERLAGMFGPPVIHAQETYANRADAAPFDHGPFDALLRQFVDADGGVDYSGMQREQPRLDTYIETLAAASLDDLGRDEHLALLINAYNAFTLRLILDHYPLASIRDIPDQDRWLAKRWQLGGLTTSLDQIENQLIRPHFKEPRIHFALVCAAIGCPKLRAEAYTGERLEKQLADQTSYVHTHDRWFRFSEANGVELTQLYQWYGSDFEQAAGSVLGFVAKQVPAVQRAIDNGHELSISYLPYDWSLNRQPNR